MCVTKVKQPCTNTLSQKHKNRCPGLHITNVNRKAMKNQLQEKACMLEHNERYVDVFFADEGKPKTNSWKNNANILILVVYSKWKT